MTWRHGWFPPGALADSHKLPLIATHSNCLPRFCSQALPRHPRFCDRRRSDACLPCRIMLSRLPPRYTMGFGFSPRGRAWGRGDRNRTGTREQLRSQGQAWRMANACEGWQWTGPRFKRAQLTPSYKELAGLCMTFHCVYILNA